jgi:hypothetical protein
VHIAGSLCELAKLTSFLIKINSAHIIFGLKAMLIWLDDVVILRVARCSKANLHGNRRKLDAIR